MDADCLDPAYAKRSENYPPTPPSVDCRLHYISGCFTYTQASGSCACASFTLECETEIHVYLYFENVQAGYWLVIISVVNEDSTTDARVKPQAVSL